MKPSERIKQFCDKVFKSKEWAEGNYEGDHNDVRFDAVLKYLDEQHEAKK